MKGRGKRLARVLDGLAARRVHSAPLLACAQELKVQPLNFLDEHQNRAASGGLFLAILSLQRLAPAPQRLELGFV